MSGVYRIRESDWKQRTRSLSTNMRLLLSPNLCSRPHFTYGMIVSRAQNQKYPFVLCFVVCFFCYGFSSAVAHHLRALLSCDESLTKPNSCIIGPGSSFALSNVSNVTISKSVEQLKNKKSISFWLHNPDWLDVIVFTCFLYFNFIVHCSNRWWLYVLQHLNGRRKKQIMYHFELNFCSWERKGTFSSFQSRQTIIVEIFMWLSFQNSELQWITIRTSSVTPQ